MERDNSKQLLKMYRNTLTQISNLDLKTLDVVPQVEFRGDKIDFEITVFKSGRCSIMRVYHWSKIETSQKNVTNIIAAIRAEDFEKAKAVTAAAEH